MPSPNTEKTSIAALITQANNIISSVNQLVDRYPIATSYEKRKTFISELYVIPKKFDLHLSLLEARESEMSAAEKATFNTLNQRFREVMSQAVDHGELLHKPPKQFKENIREQLLTLIRADDAIKLKAFIHNMSSSSTVKDVDYALRNAAHFGAIECLKILCGPYPKSALANIFSEGETSKNIALHAAINAGRPNCVRILLNTMNTWDGRAPVAQLTYGQAPNRPIDCLEKLENSEQCVEICNVILENSLDDYYPQSNFSSLKQEIIQMVTKLKKERLETQKPSLNTQNLSPSMC